MFHSKTQTQTAPLLQRLDPQRPGLSLVTDMFTINRIPRTTNRIPRTTIEKGQKRIGNDLLKGLQGSKDLLVTIKYSAERLGQLFGEHIAPLCCQLSETLPRVLDLGVFRDLQCPANSLLLSLNGHHPCSSFLTYLLIARLSISSAGKTRGRSLRPDQRAANSPFLFRRYDYRGEGGRALDE